MTLIGTFYLTRKGRGNSVRQLSLLIFSFGLIFQFSMSAVYHLLEPGLVPRYVLQVLDHSAIFVLIAGTFTPIHVILFRGVSRWGVLGTVWSLAITGIVLTSVFFDSIPEWLTLCFYIGLGWIGLITFLKLRKTYGGPNNFFIIPGGIFYTLGALLEFTRWPVLVPGIVGPHELFHIFVILGAYSHWRYIYSFADSPISAEFIIQVVENQDGFYAYSETESVTFQAHSLEEIKEQVSHWIEEKYHISMRPEKINLKISKEEYIAPFEGT
ncbi:MAG: DNA-binding protein [Halobacteriovoraceae bacterium]|nr:DNA-binding protein [Halobacteriovoraceae bacterium]